MSLYHSLKFKFGVTGVLALLVLGAVFWIGSVEKPDGFRDMADLIQSHSELDMGNDVTAITDKKAKTARRPVFIAPTQLSLNIPYPDAIENSKQVENVPERSSQNLMQKYNQKRPVFAPGTAKIAIIIDDMGMSYKWTSETINIDYAPLTLAFLPYAENLNHYVKSAKQNGHELIIHTPMQPMNPDLDMGPIALHTELSESEFREILTQKVFQSFEGYVGVNNHMGSRLTQDAEAMGWLMQELKRKNLFFVDSKTIATSVAARKAAEYGVSFAERDIFLDHVDEYSAVMRSFTRLEKVAQEKGFAIAIGHPKENTIEALKIWLPDALKRGVEIVPVSMLLTHMETAPSGLHMINN